MPRVVIVQHVPCETAGTIESVLADAGLEFHYARPFAGTTIPQTTDGLDGLVVMGGPMGVYQTAEHPHLLDELKLIRDACAEGIPVLGICLGSQLLAAALGSQVRPGKQKEIGWFEVGLRPGAAADPLFSHAPPAFMALHWHGDVFELPAGAVPLASSRLTPTQAFRWRDRAYGILFHLESTPELLEGMIATFADELNHENLAPDLLRRGSVEYFPPAQRIGRTVFSAWARLVLDNSSR